MKCGRLVPDLGSHADVAELMDDPFCDDARLLRTVAGFRSLNRGVTRYQSVLKRWILSDILDAPKRQHTVADLGAGGCDTAVWLLRESQRLLVDVEVLAIEADSRIAEYARRTCKSVAGLRVIQADAMDLSVMTKSD